jgi:hypothetical protein
VRVSAVLQAGGGPHHMCKARLHHDMIEGEFQGQ